MNIRKLSVSNFMIFDGVRDYELSRINVITGRNESGKSVLAVDTLKYIFQKRIRFRKLQDVVNVNIPDGDVFASVVLNLDQGGQLGLKRYVNHSKFKQNIVVALLNGDGSPDNAHLIPDLVDLSGVKHLKLKDALKSLNCDLEFFDLISVFNPMKNVMQEKGAILNMLKMNFDNVIKVFRSVYSDFEASIQLLNKDLVSIEQKIIQVKRDSLSDEEQAELKKQLEELEKRIEKGRGYEEAANKAISSLNNEITSLRGRAKQHETEIKKYLKFKETGTCFTCGRPFDGDASIIENGIRSNESVINECREKIGELSKKLSDANQKYEAIRKRLWELIQESKQLSSQLSKRTGEIETLERLLDDKKRELRETETQFLRFKKIYDKVFDKENIERYQKYTIAQFEQLYTEIYSLLTDEHIDIELNLGKYDEPVFDGIYYSGLSTSKKRIVALTMMLSLHLTRNMQFKTIVLDEFFDVFDPYRSIKVIDGLFENSLFEALQFIITSNNEAIVEHIRSTYNENMTLINLVDKND